MFNRMWFAYLVAGLAGVALFNPQQYHLQFRNTYIANAKSLMSCAPDGCPVLVLQEAGLYYANVAAMFPTYETYNALGFCFYELGAYRPALVNFQKAVKLSPNNFGLRFNLALAYARLGMAQQAKQALNLATDLVKDINNFYFPSMKFPSRQWPGQILDDPQLRVAYEWRYARQQCQDLLDHMDDKGKKISAARSSLYYYIPIYNVKSGGKDVTSL